MQRQGALADSALAGAHGHQVAHRSQPVGDAGALLDHLLEDSGAAVADDVVIALHYAGMLAYTGGCARRALVQDRGLHKAAAEAKRS